MKIKKPGLYKTRDGLIVVVTEVRPQKERLSYPVRGYVVNWEPRWSDGVEWTTRGIFTMDYPDHQANLVEEITDPVLKALYED